MGIQWRSLLVVGLLLGVSPAFAAGPLERENLKGLQGVFVLVEGIDKDAQNAGLSEDTIQTDVELRLRLAGIKVLTEAECLKTPGYPYLYVNLNATNRANSLIYSIGIDLNQRVTLARDPSTVTHASTWHTGSVGIGGVEFIRNAIKSNIDVFLNDYLAANPKK